MSNNRAKTEAIVVAGERVISTRGEEQRAVVLSPYEPLADPFDAEYRGAAERVTFARYQFAHQVPLYTVPAIDGRGGVDVYGPVHPYNQPEGIRFVSTYFDYRYEIIKSVIGTDPDPEERHRYELMFDMYMSLSGLRERLNTHDLNADELSDSYKQLDGIAEAIRGNLGVFLGDQIGKRKVHGIRLAPLTKVLDGIAPDTPRSFDSTLSDTESLLLLMKASLLSNNVPKMYFAALDGYNRRYFSERYVIKLRQVAQQLYQVGSPTIDQIKDGLMPLANYMFKGESYSPLFMLYRNSIIAGSLINVSLQQALLTADENQDIHDFCEYPVNRANLILNVDADVVRTLMTPLTLIDPTKCNIEIKNYLALSDVAKASLRKFRGSGRIKMQMLNLNTLDPEKRYGRVYTSRIKNICAKYSDALRKLSKYADEEGNLKDVPYRELDELRAMLLDLRRAVLV